MLERHVKLFRNGRNEAVMLKDRDRLIIEPAPPSSLLAILASLSPLDVDFPDIADPPPGPVEL